MSDSNHARMDLSEGAGPVPAVWQTRDELDPTKPGEDRGPEFPPQADIWPEDLKRRRFLAVMGASTALAGAAGCVVQPQEYIVPYVRQPEQIVPGRPLYFATASVVGGFATGVVVESHMGRPTKVEGNPHHPASLGAADIFAQASILGLYDPDRSQVVTFNGRVSTWDRFLSALIGLRTQLLADPSRGLRFITGTVTSPTELRLINRVLELFPSARWCIHDPVGFESTVAGAELAFNTNAWTIHDVAAADVIVSIDGNFLAEGPSHLRDARAFAARREPGQPPNRLYQVEVCPTVTGASADHRAPLTLHEIQAFARALASALGVEGVKSEGSEPVKPAWFSALVQDLQANKGRSLVIVGESQPGWVHALAHAINQKLGNVGATVRYVEPIAPRPPIDRSISLESLSQEMASGSVEVLMVLGANPVYDAPADLEFGKRLLRVPTRIHLGLHADETAALCNWHIPQAHSLESWGDARAFDGTVTVLQPLIAPLYAGKTAAELLAALADGTPPPSRLIVEDTWRGNRTDSEFREFWTKSLNNGVIAESEAKPKQVLLQNFAVPDAAAGGGSLELAIRPDPTIRDGSHANNGWLQELPKPLSTLTWDNAAQIGPQTAQSLGVADGDLVMLGYRERALEAAALITPGHAEGVVTLTLGYGRSNAGRVGTKTVESGGFNAYALRTSDAPWGGSGLVVSKAEGRYPLALTQAHWRFPDPSTEAQERQLVLVSTRSEFDRHDESTHGGHSSPHHEPDPALTIYEHPEPMQRRIDGEGNRWGMVVNLTACIGCNACVVACQAENNIPVVGKDQVMRGREMHWIRIDRYYATTNREAPDANPRFDVQPVLCMHCENAPCELVCPVAATTHSPEGLNEMTYNRCVGTRYCSNNCPYKVRRFNFFQYTKSDEPALKLLYNPDVTVRTRGVMEKCTYCVQRINAARIEAEIAGAPRVAGDAVATACQQTCPTRAITFGNMNDPAATVNASKHDPRHYSLLGELNTRPRTTYLQKLTNPNPAIEA